MMNKAIAENIDVMEVSLDKEILKNGKAQIYTPKIRYVADGETKWLDDSLLMKNRTI